MLMFVSGFTKSLLFFCAEWIPRLLNNRFGIDSIRRVSSGSMGAFL